MPSAPTPENEAARLDALRRLDILDTPGDAALDALTEQAALVCNAPAAVISLVDARRQWFKARVGVDSDETCRSQAFCAYAILSDELLVVPDATLDPRFSDNELVLGPPHIRAYAGAPLILKNGHRVGTLCVIHFEPTHLSADQLKTLRGLAKKVVLKLEQRAERHARSGALAALCESAERSDTAVVVLNRALDTVAASDAWLKGASDKRDMELSAACDAALIEQTPQEAHTAGRCVWSITPWRDDVGQIGGVVVALASPHEGRAR